MSARFAALVVRLRWLVLLAWIGATVAVTLTLPTLREAQTGPLGDLVPVDSQALEAEQRSFESFAFPFLSRTIVAERDPDGVGLERLATFADRAQAINEGRLAGLQDAAGAYVVSNHLGPPGLVRERGTTVLMPVLFPEDIGQTGRTLRAERIAEDHLQPAPPGATTGVTGAIPARDAQADLIEQYLPLVEAVTLALVILTVAVYVRSIVAPIVALGAVAVAYLVAIRIIAVIGQALGISVPSEVEPVIVALLFGVVTDYVLFYVGRFRRRVREGQSPHDAARIVSTELTPILVASGLAVAAASAALGVAELGFLRAFGPGMAISVVVGLLVSITFIPALLAVGGRALLWPAARPEIKAPPSPRQDALLTRIVRHPVLTIVATVLVLVGASVPVLWLELGNPVIRGLPAGSEPRAIYEEVQQGFAPGVVAPTVIVLEGPGLVRDRPALRELSAVLEAQPGVAGVVGPGQNPFQRPLGAVLSRGGDAARFLVVFDEDPLGADAIRQLQNLKARLDGLVEAVGIDDARVFVAGDTALVAETIDLATEDLARVVPAVLGAVLVVLVVFLRAIVAPLYLVACAALAPLAATGLAVVLFQWILGAGEITYYVPIAAGVLLVSLGSDYNVFLVGRVWAEARRRPLREAIVTGGTQASRAIAAAALVLAGSFAATALVPVQAFRELGFLVAVGLLLDGFVVRTVLVPAVIALVGERSGWPGHALDVRYPARQIGLPDDRPRSHGRQLDRTAA